MKQILSTLSHSTRRYLAALTLLFLFSACTQTPTPDNSNTPSSTIEASDENGNTITTQAVPVNGLKGDYYNNMDFTGTLKTRYDANVNRSWGTAAPISGIANTTYSVRWTGQIQPQFSQEYTFFVTSSGGARLMVNGQVLVNNWTDHASKVDSGKVTLQANVKYDIRLEFFRNTSNPAIIKLEWQSASRAKQVVPQARLFTTGSNAETAWKLLKALPLGASLSSDAYLEASISYQTQQGQLFWFAEKGQNQGASILGVIKNNTLLFARRQRFDNGNLIVTDLTSNRSLDFGKAEIFYDKDSSNDAIQKKRYEDKSLELQGLSITSSRLTAQAVNGAACPTCVVLQDKYVISSTLLANYVWITGLYYSGPILDCVNKVSVENCIKGVIGSLALDLATAGFNPSKLFDDIIEAANQAARDLLNWENCKLTAKCEPKIGDPTPNPLKLNGKVGEFVNGSIAARNIGFWGLRPIVSSASSWIELTTSGLSGNVLSENATLTILVKAKCEQAGTTFGLIFLNTTSTAPDPTYQEQKTIDVELKCTGEPKIQADSKSWSLQVNQSLSQPDNIVIKNDGTDVLKISNFDYQVGSLGTASITPTLPAASLTAPLEIPAGDSRNIPVNAVCGSTPGTLEGTITISSNAVPNGSLSVGVSLECTGFNTVIVGRDYYIGGALSAFPKCFRNPDDIPWMGDLYTATMVYFRAVFWHKDAAKFRKTPGLESEFAIPDTGLPDSVVTFEKEKCGIPSQFPNFKAKMSPIVPKVVETWEDNAYPKYKLTNIRWNPAQDLGGVYADVIQVAP